MSTDDSKTMIEGDWNRGIIYLHRPGTAPVRLIQRNLTTNLFEVTANLAATHFVTAPDALLTKVNSA